MKKIYVEKGFSTNGSAMAGIRKLLFVALCIGALSAGAYSQNTQAAFEKPPSGNSIIARASSDNYCSGSGIAINFITKGVYNTDNVFIAQLSNASGNFDYPVEIGRLNGSSEEQIYAPVPSLSRNGRGYRVRVISTSPQSVSRDNGFDISIEEAPQAEILVSKPMHFSPENPVILTAPAGELYTWSNGSRSRSVAVYESGTYLLQVSNKAGCSKASSVVVNADSKATDIVSETEAPACSIIRAYPNPAYATFYLLLNNMKFGKVQVQVISSHGVVVYQKWMNVSGKTEIIPVNLRTTLTGTYLVKVISDKDVQTTSIVLKG